MKHKCPIAGCNEEIPGRLLMCAEHWRLVPQLLRVAVVKAMGVYWNARYFQHPRKEQLDAIARLREAQQAAIAAVSP